MKTRLGNGHASTPCKTTLVRGLLWGLPYSLFFREDEGDYSSKHLSRKKVCHIFSPKYTWLSFLAKFQLCIPFVALLKLLRRKGPAVAGMGYWITATVQGSSWVRVVPSVEGTQGVRTYVWAQKLKACTSPGESDRRWTPLGSCWITRLANVSSAACRVGMG